MTAKQSEPPTLLELTRMLREANEAFDGGDFVTLGMLDGLYWGVWVVGDPAVCRACGREFVPGDGKPFDAVACARRLLAAFRDCKTQGGL